MTMPNLQSYLATICQVIETEMRAIQGQLDLVNDDFAKAVDLILNINGHVVVTGMGKSGLIGKKIAATFASTGTRAIFLHPAEGLHGDLGMVSANDVILAISKSGEVEEFHRLFPFFKRYQLPIIAITANSNSSLAQNADIFLPLSNHEEACPHQLAPTSSTTATLVIGDALAVALLKARNFQKEHFAIFHPGGSLGQRLIARVSDYMHADKEMLPILPETATMEDVLKTMSRIRGGIVAFVNEMEILTGILTYGDIGRLLLKYHNIVEMRPADLMNRNPKTIFPNELAVDAAQLMEEKRITGLIVVDESHRPIGIVNLHELMQLGIVK